MYQVSRRENTVPEIRRSVPEPAPVHRPLGNRKRLTLDRILAVLSLAWFGALVWVPDLQTVSYCLAITGILIFVNLAVALAGLYYSRRLFLLLSLGQVLLLSIIHVQIFAALGPHHYQFDHAPGWWDWLAFGGAHILRAADALDFIEGYDIGLQHIIHTSALAGFMLVLLHLSVDLFLFAFLLHLFSGPLQRLLKKLGLGLKPRPGRMMRIMKLALFGFLVALVWMVCAAFAQGWRWQDWFLWPLDNILRLLDVTDVMDIFHWRLHGVESGFWNNTLAFLFRFLVGVFLLAFLRLIILGVFPQILPYSVDYIIETMFQEDADPDWPINEFMARLVKKLPEDARTEVLECVTERLRDPDWQVQERAQGVFSCFIMENVDVFPFLFPLLRDENPPVQVRAAELLGTALFKGRSWPKPWKEVDEFEGALVKLLPSEFPEVREAAVKQFHSLYTHYCPTVGFDYSAAFLTEWETIQKAVRTSPTLPLVLKRLEDSNREVKKSAIVALGAIYGGISDKSVEQNLLHIVDNGSPDLQQAALTSLVSIQNADVIPLLTKKLGNENLCVMAANHLLAMAPGTATAAIPYLLRLLGNERVWNWEVACTISQIRPVTPDALQAMVGLLRHQEAAARHFAAEALGNMGPDAMPALQQLKKLLEDPDDILRTKATEALSKIKPALR